MSQTNSPVPTHVVTSFLLRRDQGEDRVLLVRRSDRVRTYRGAWGAVSGYLEPGVTPLEQAHTEMREEAGVDEPSASLLRSGEPLAVDDNAQGLHWVVHPFLFLLMTPDAVRTDWEATDHRWVRPDEVASYQTVPKLLEALAEVYPPEASHDAPDLPEPLRAAIERIRDDRDHGASWLAHEAAAALAEASVPGALDNDDERLERLRQAARALATTRPSMAALSNTVARIWFATRSAGGTGGEASTASARLRALHDAAEAQLRAWDEASAGVYRHARPLLGGELFTHSRSGTVEDVLLRYAAEQREQGKGDAFPALWLTESRPGGEGIALARALAPAGWRITIIADAAVGTFVREAAAVVVGADSIRADGGVVNKIGTYPLALAAQRAGVPMYVLTESVKIAAPSAPLVLEAMDPRELLPEPVPGISARNPYFELTPAELVTATITEHGHLSQQDIAAIARDAERDLAFLLSG